MKLIDKIPKEVLDATNDFAKRLEWGRRIPIYETYKWWARRYSGIIRLFLAYNEMDYSKCRNIDTNINDFVESTYYNPPKVNNKALLDPFCGGGTILFEGSQLGYDTYGIELNELAYLGLTSWNKITKNSLTELKNDIIKISEDLKDLWTTKCDKGHEATLIHTFLAWKNSKEELQIKYNEIKKLKSGSVYYCDNCDQIFNNKSNLRKCPNCDHKFDVCETKEYKKAIPFAIEYYCSICGERAIKKLDSSDEEKFYLNYKNKLSKIPKLKETNRLLYNGFNTFDELLTRRQLYTFDYILQYSKGKDYENIAKLMISNCLRSCSYLAFYSGKYRKVIPGFIIKSYWLPVQTVELNPLSYIFDKKMELMPLGRGNIVSSYRKIRKANKWIKDHDIKFQPTLYLDSAQNKLKTFNKKFDIVFTDPPYMDYQFYSDLSLFASSVINKNTESRRQNLLKNELVLRNKNEIDNYLDKMNSVFYHMKKCLNNDGKLMLTFHHPDHKILKNFLYEIKTNSFYLDAIYPVLGESSGKISKRKLYLDLLFIFNKKRQKNPYYTTTDVYYTEEDKDLISVIPDLINIFTK